LELPQVRKESAQVMAKRWSDLSPRTRKLIIVAGAAEVGLKAAAAIDLKRRPADQIRGPKWAWFAGLLINSAGLIPLSYFVYGRRRDMAG
jgi:NADH:ubiquinone oxidoreductase subunit B-like Fe-S oxidoreductase